MFIVVPLRHDQAVYTMPRVTNAIAVVCALLFVWSAVTEGDARIAFTGSVGTLGVRMDAAPDARISPELAQRLPSLLQRELADTVAADAAAAVDPTLEMAAWEAGRALRRLPNFRLGYIPAEHRLWTAVTSLFMHADVMHLLGNLVFLFIAASVLECFWLEWAYVALFFASGLGGVLLHHLIDPYSVIPLVGASGAIAGLMGAFLHRYGRVNITMGYLLFAFSRVVSGTFQVPAYVIIPLWAVLQVVDLFTHRDSGVAFGAHLGGFVVGLAFSFVASRRNWIASDAGYSVA